MQRDGDGTGVPAGEHCGDDVVTRSAQHGDSIAVLDGERRGEVHGVVVDPGERPLTGRVDDGEAPVVTRRPDPGAAPSPGAVHERVHERWATGGEPRRLLQRLGGTQQGHIGALAGHELHADGQAVDVEPGGQRQRRATRHA